MRCRPVFVAGAAIALASLAVARPARAQADPGTVELVVPTGRPLRVTLDERISINRVGQPVSGTVAVPVYAYDRIVIPAGARVRGHVSAIDGGSRLSRARAYMRGNLSPAKHATLQFDTLVDEDGAERAIETVVSGGIPNVQRQVAGGSRSRTPETVGSDGDAPAPSLTSRATAEVTQRTTGAIATAKQKAHDSLASIRSLREPGQMSRLRDAAVQQLPYHPQYIAKGTVYDATLSTPLSFGRVVPSARAPAGTAPAPDSILTARLTTTLDSSKTPKGTPFEAVITETVFSADRNVILPEGTKLTGTVTLATPARRFHRNGQLRFLFEAVQVPGEAAEPLLGQLHAVDASADDRVAVDDEGGATLENSNTRFIAPALSLLTLHASVEHDGHSFADPDGDGSIKHAGSGAGARGMGGFIGMGLIGAAVSQVTRPAGIALSAYGAARTMYSNVLGKGREVTFAADTPVQVRLAGKKTEN